MAPRVVTRIGRHAGGGLVFAWNPSSQAPTVVVLVAARALAHGIQVKGSMVRGQLCTIPCGIGHLVTLVARTRCRHVGGRIEVAHGREAGYVTRSAVARGDSVMRIRRDYGQPSWLRHTVTVVTERRARCGNMKGRLVVDVGVRRNVAIETSAAGDATVGVGRYQRQPAGHPVADVTGRSRWNMADRLNIDVRIAGDVAGCASSGCDTSVAVGRDQRHPGGRAVADVAGGRCRDVLGLWLRLCIDCGVGAVVAVIAQAGGARVAHRRRGEGGEDRVAGIAGTRGRDVVGRLG